MAAIPTVKSRKTANYPFLVQVKNTENWNTSSSYKTHDEAMQHAQGIAKEYPRLPVRIEHCTGGPIKL